MQDYKSGIDRNRFCNQIKRFADHNASFKSLFYFSKIDRAPYKPVCLMYGSVDHAVLCALLPLKY